MKDNPVKARHCILLSLFQYATDFNYKAMNTTSFNVDVAFSTVRLERSPPTGINVRQIKKKSKNWTYIHSLQL